MTKDGSLVDNQAAAVIDFSKTGALQLRLTPC